MSTLSGSEPRQQKQSNKELKVLSRRVNQLETNLASVRVQAEGIKMINEAMA